MNQVQQRVEDIFSRHTEPVVPDRKTPLRPVAVAWSRKPIMRAHATNMRSIIDKAISSFYEEDAAGRLWNVSDGGKVEPVPWGRNGYKRWQVKRIYAEAIKSELMRTQSDRSLFIWDRPSMSWYLNLDYYPTIEAAQEWLDGFGLSAEKAYSMIEAFRERNKGSHGGSHAYPQG